MFRYISGANGNSGDDALLSEDGGINVRSLPEDVQAVFADIDANGDGVLDMEEFKTMLSTYAVLRRSNQEGSVSISTLPDKVQPALKVFDQDGDGTVDPKELMRAAGSIKPPRSPSDVCVSSSSVSCYSSSRSSASTAP